MLKNKRVWVGLLVTLLFLVLFVRQVEFPKVEQALQQANFLLLLLAIPIYFAGVWFRVLRWKQLMAHLRLFRAKELFPYVVIGYMANDLLPMRVGELVRSYILGERYRLGKASILGSIALERLSDGLTLIAFMAAIALFVPLSGWLDQLLRFMALLFFGALAVLLLVLFNRTRSLRLLGQIAHGAPAGLSGRFLHLAEGLLDGMSALNRPRRVGAVAIYGMLAWACEAGVFYVVGTALEVQSPIFVFFLAMSVANLATTLPSSQAGIGPFEYFCAQTFVMFGTEASLAATYAVVLHIVLILPVTLLGFVYLSIENLSLAQIVQRSGALTGTSIPALGEIPAKD